MGDVSTHLGWPDDVFVSCVEVEGDWRCLVRPTAEVEKFCYRIAKRRNDDKVLNGVPNHKIDRKQDDMTVNYGGYLAEYCAARLFDARASTEIKRHGDNGAPDFFTSTGLGVEVKFSSKFWYEFGLYSDDPKDLQADLGIHALPDKDGVLLYGYITREDFIRYARVKRIGRNLRAMVPHHRMEPLHRLLPGLLR